MQFRSIFSFAVALAMSASAGAANDQTGELRVEQAYARSTVPAKMSGAVYLTIENKGKTNDKLIAVTGPIAKSVEMHTMSMDGNVMKMREVQSIEIKPAATVAMKPGDGYHIMLVGLKQPLKSGDKFPLTLSFEKFGKLKISVRVEDRGTR